MSYKNPKFNFPPNTGSKRPRIDSDSSSPIEQVYDRFFKVTRVDGSFKTTSPFLLYKALQSKFGKLADTRKQADGSILIEVSNSKQSEIAKELTKLQDFEVKSVAHKTLNAVKGVITCSDLQYSTDEEILENLGDQGVTEIYRIPNRKDPSKASYTFIVTFKLHQLPTRINAGWYSIRVRPYIPAPMRCFTCQKFGHTAAKCAQDPVCPSCGHTSHTDSPCTTPPKCTNCGEQHSPRYKGCKKYKTEFEIQKLKTTEKISYFEAKRLYNATHLNLPTSFSSVVKTSKKMVNAATQCDITVTPQNQTPHLLTPLQINITPTNPPPKSPPSSPHQSIHTPTPNRETKKNTKTDSIHNTSTKITSTKPNTTRLYNTTSHKDLTKKKPSRSLKSTPSSSSESILDINTPDIHMETDPITSGKKIIKKK